MVEIRTFEGDAAEISAFTIAQWRKSYEGRMTMPLWPPRFLDWELNPDRQRDYLVAAYDGTKLVGFLPAQPFRFRSRDAEFAGTVGSWLSVDPDYRRQAIAKRLHEEQRRRHRERGEIWNFGYLYLGARVAMGKKFWPHSQEGVATVARLGLWARVLDHRVVAGWLLSRLESVGTRLLSLVQAPPREPADCEGIRPYRTDDLAVCCRLVAGLSRDVDLGYLWSCDRLARQLQHHDIPRTLVAEENGRVAGLINYCPLDFLARGQIPVAVIDLLCLGALSVAGQKRLLQVGLRQMADEGFKLALLLRVSCYPAWPLLKAGFVPLPVDHALVGLPMQPGLTLPKVRRMHIHWR